MGNSCQLNRTSPSNTHYERMCITDMFWYVQLHFELLISGSYIILDKNKDEM